MNERDTELLRITREYLKGCTCSSPRRPFECKECTEGFIEAAIESEIKFGAKVGPGKGEIDHMTFTRPAREPDSSDR